MSTFDLLWIFLLAATLYPLLKQRFVEAYRRGLITQIENQQNSRLIMLIHRQETLSLFGLPIFRFIDINDSEEILRAIHQTDPNMPIDIILHTPGGLILASLQIARALRGHKGKVRAFVPHYAMSGGTLIALAADEIIMSKHAVLGPVDPIIGNYPAASLLKLVKNKPIAKTEDQTLILADQAEKAMTQLTKSITELLEARLSKKEAEKLSKILSEGRWTHDYALTVDEARQLGLPVLDEMPEMILQLMSLYPQPTRHSPSVIYLPEPHR